MNNYPNTGAGLKKMFIAAVGAVICTVLVIIPIINILAGIAALVFAIISMIGLYSVGKDIDGCKKAFTLTIVNLLVGLFAGIFSKGFVGVLFGAAKSVLAFLIVYYVCTSLAAVLKERNAADVAAKGETVWKINLVCYAASIVISILALIPIIKIFAALLNVVVAIVSLVATILYMIFLNQSAKNFGA